MSNYMQLTADVPYEQGSLSAGHTSPSLLDNRLEQSANQSSVILRTLRSPRSFLSFWIQSMASSRYGTNLAGFSVAGKWPSPSIVLCAAPGILAAVAWKGGSSHVSSLCPFDTKSRLTYLSHGRRVAPIVLASEHVDRAGSSVDAGQPRVPVPAAEVKVEIAVEDAVGLGGVRVPHEGPAGRRSGRGLHAIYPFGVEEGLVHYRMAMSNVLRFGHWRGLEAYRMGIYRERDVAW